MKGAGALGARLSPMQILRDSAAISRRFVSGAVAAGIVLQAGACHSADPKADPKAPTALTRNLLANPGFEAGSTGWTHMGTQAWGAFDIVGEPVHSGTQAALLSVVTTPDAYKTKSKVFGVVQEIRRETLPGGFPETLSGWYYVKDWSKSVPTTDMYLQVVVIVWGDPRTGALCNIPDPSKATNYQIRFYLKGLEKPAFTLTNAKLSFEGRGQPTPGSWVRFEIPVRKRFQELWGVVPDNYEFLRVLFEARWDNKVDGSEVASHVLYDDLFFGYGASPETPVAKHP